MANVITISALNAYVKTILERDPVLTDIALKGEISNFTNHFKTGHFYFTLKDEKCSVKAVMFRTYAQQVPFMPQNGMSVIVRCRISLFERDGTFQVYVENMFPDGIGSMQLAYEQLKARLEAEGLFDVEHKQMLPSAPKCVGLVTSKTGAAIQDIINVTNRRCPMAQFLLAPVNVQGEDAADGIARAIERLDKSGRVDVIIVARGGGSKEDLWVFNSEKIARAAYNCKTPIVSAIGHEIDFCILDFVADMRAPTPSAAAEIVMPDIMEENKNLYKKYTNICNTMQNVIKRCYNKCISYENSPFMRKAAQKPTAYEARLSVYASSIKRQMEHITEKREIRLAHSAALASSLNPHSVLARGYSVAEINGAVIKSVKQLKGGDSISLNVADGSARCTVNEITNERCVKS